MVEPTPITDAVLAELERLEKAATPGPWYHDAKFQVGSVSDDDDQSFGMLIPLADVFGDNREVDINLIVTARNALPSLLHRLRTAEADQRKLDAVVHALGIEDSEDDPVEEIRALQQDASERDHFNRLAFVDVGTGAETWKERAEKAEAEVARLRDEYRHHHVLVEALSEIKATVDGASDQPVKDIIYGCIAELASRPDPAQPGQSSAQPAAKRVAACTCQSFPTHCADDCPEHGLEDGT